MAVLDRGFSKGSQIGPYVIVGPVAGGHGGMATVYRARLYGQGEVVALKVARPGLGSFLKDETAFLKAMRLEHPHIIRVLPTPIDGSSSEYVVKDPQSGLWYFAMEYLAGGSLDDWLRRRKRLSLAQAVEVVRQVGSALDAAHQAGIVHLDVKPSNILFRSKPEKGNLHAVLTDFGIARTVGGRGEAGSSTLTIEYASPEQVRQALGEPTAVGPSADLYSLAVILYEMISGQLPFGEVENEVTAMHRIIYEEVPLPVPHGPEELTPILERAMAKDAAARFPSCRAFVAALESLPPYLLQRPPEPPEHPTRRLHPALTVALALVLGAVGGFLAGRATVPPPTSTPPAIVTTVEVTRVVTATPASLSEPSALEPLATPRPAATVTMAPTRAVSTPTRPPTSTPVPPTDTPRPRPTSAPQPTPTPGG